MSRKKNKRKVDNAGHSKVEHGRYMRSDTKKMARYSIKKDVKRRSKYLSAPGKPMTGDNNKVLYNPKNSGEYIVLARYAKYAVKVKNKVHYFNSKREAQELAKKHKVKVKPVNKWIPVNYDGKKKEAVKHKDKYRKWKVGYV